MIERDEARSRIRQRRCDGNLGYLRNTNKKSFWLHSMITIVLLMVCCISIIGIDNSLLYISKINAFMHTNIPWSKIIPFEKWGDDFGEYGLVSGNQGYYKTENIGLYKNDSNMATSLGDGLVVYIGKNNNYQFVVVSHDNGISITYGNLDFCNVQLYDRVLKGSSIGVFTDLIKLEAMRDNMDIDVEEVFSSFED